MKYLDDYTGFDEDDPEGNFLALRFNAQGETITITLGESEVELDDDEILIARITDETELTASTDKESITYTLDLTLEES